MHATEARTLVRKFGDVTVVDGVEFAVEQGEIFGFFGPNAVTTDVAVMGLLAVAFMAPAVWLFGKQH